MNNIGRQMSGGVECRFDTMCCNESKWYPIMIIGRQAVNVTKEYIHSV